MWKKFFAMGIILSAGMTYAEELAAQWDFTRGSINSTDGKFKAAFRGTTRIAGDEKEGKYLAVGMSSKEKPEGIVMAEKYPELSPSRGFRVEAKIRLREPTGTQGHLVIWDSKYIFYTPKKDLPSYNRGFAFLLCREKDGLFRPAAWIGHGEKSDFLPGTPVKLDEGEIHTLSFEYDGSLQGTFKVDGKVNRVSKAKYGGAVAPASYNTVIGDRVGSSYNHFDGDIFDVKLFTFPKAEKK